MVFGIGKEIQEVLPENLENLLSEGYKLIDVREQDEWDAGHHEEAKHVPMGTIPEKINDFNSNEKYIIICRSGGRSGRVCSFMEEEGLSPLNLKGGMNKLSPASKKIVNSNGGTGTVI